MGKMQDIFNDSSTSLKGNLCIFLINLKSEPNFIVA